MGKLDNMLEDKDTMEKIWQVQLLKVPGGRILCAI